MAAISDFMQYVLPYVPGCTYPLAELHIRNICIDFCTHAPIVQEQLDPINLIKGQREYDLDTAAGTVTTIVLQAKYQGRDLDICKIGDTTFDYTDDQFGAPTGIMQAAGNLFTLNIKPIANERAALSLIVATKPTAQAPTVADVLLNDYAYEIGQGAVARLLKIPGQPFSNPATSIAYEATYTTARTAARIRAESSFGAASSRVKPRRFGF